MLRVLLLGISTFALSAFAMFVSGMFPAAARPARMRGMLGTILLGIAGVLCLALALATVRGLGGGIHWPYAVVSGGFGVLLGPLAFQGLPRAWQDTPRGAGLIGIGLLLASLGWMTLT